ncbi:succinate dehydrogenase, hydrophobic membrane anchor protein [Porphyrobacter sp. CACIAM 03H1]|jgi:succinate dehydrogenase / fumarate reductase membrane anchor subunit|uniref:succinate dehydrogenase, hydrophobic membrane anchor protein n=1 Tax=Porphyrobacter sp. CACIAM 03H1 TaxID=2003315 RepID=UPI000B5A6D48|nr:succinate dehydrogenase, hydrophobic membrane anchor protein [Porphyrobacter sp. CACIAM 03H1]ASJ89580.1 succinate dehydrogenase, hydrophobic membrane anchor protein [Porphyrobacter sp. CACIAM 03H1]
MAKQDTRHETHRLDPGKGGAEDFIAVRLNSLALIVLYAWLLTAIVLLLPDLSHRAVTGWLRHPLNALLMVLLIGLTFWHVKYGLNELIDDYVHAPVARIASLATMHTLTWTGALFALISLARIVLVPA